VSVLIGIIAVKLWVDADACPGVIKEIILKAAIKRSVETVFVANKKIFIPDVPHISVVHVAQGADIADQYIAEHAEPGDLVITQDVPLAAILVPIGVGVMSFHGTLYTDANIGERLSVRNFYHELRSTGVQTGGPKPFSDKDKQQFANTFDQQLTKRLN
jgi:uncharacterized protein